MLDGSGQSSTRIRPPGSQGAPTPRQGRRRVAQLVQGVLEVGEVEVPPDLEAGHVAMADLDPIGEPGGRHVGPRTRRRSRARTRARRARGREPPGHGDEPATAAAVDVHDPAARGQVGDQLRQLGERLLEEDGHVLDGQPLDRLRGSGPAAAGSGRRSGRTRACPPSRARRPRRGRTGRRGTPGAPRRAG